MCRIHSLRRHYPDQLGGTGEGVTSHITAGLASSAPDILLSAVLSYCKQTGRVCQPSLRRNLSKTAMK